MSPSPSATVDPAHIACVDAQQSLNSYLDHLDNDISDTNEAVKAASSDSARLEIYRAAQATLDADARGFARIVHPASLDRGFALVATGVKGFASSNRLFVKALDDRSNAEYVKATAILTTANRNMTRGLHLIEGPSACP